MVLALRSPCQVLRLSIGCNRSTTAPVYEHLERARYVFSRTNELGKCTQFWHVSPKLKHELHHFIGINQEKEHAATVYDVLEFSKNRQMVHAAAKMTQQMVTTRIVEVHLFPSQQLGYPSAFLSSGGIYLRPR